jgi:cysteinyl-tRNA synthetase
MIRRHLGETVDIHAGGIDLVFPHHENEAAQSRCAHGGAPLARYWLHNGFVDFGAEKMSKSLGNVVTPEELFAAGHKGEVLRLALLSAHYRSPLPWTESLLAQSKATLDGLYRRVGEAKAGKPDAGVLDALGDDLNTALALSRLGQVEDAAALKASAALLGLLPDTATRWFQGGSRGADGSDDNEKLETWIRFQVEARVAAKKARNFVEADRIRDALKAEGILLEDGPQGTTWRRA